MLREGFRHILGTVPERNPETKTSCRVAAVLSINFLSRLRSTICASARKSVLLWVGRSKPLDVAHSRVEFHEMIRGRYIGEFRGSYFLISTFLFLLFGGFLYSKCDFRLEPRPLDELSRQQQEIDHLEQHIDQVERVTEEVQSTVQKGEKETQHS